MNNHYFIEGTAHLKPSLDYENKELYPKFHLKVDELKELLNFRVSNKIPTTFYKFGDGDYYFLKKQHVGSAMPGKRALRKPYFLINHKKFVQGSKKNDFYTTLLPEMHTRMFYELFDKNFDFPSEAVYGLLANKWIFQNFENIGLIGADKKLDLIKNLMEFDQYKDYLGIEKFNDYIKIPQKYACDNLSRTIKNVRKQLLTSSSSLFLVGVGHVKSGLLHELKEYKNAVFLDVGVGIDAIAGIINKNRPYFGLWENYHIKDYFDYENLDVLINSPNDSFGKIKYL